MDPAACSILQPVAALPEDVQLRSAADELRCALGGGLAPLAGDEQADERPGEGGPRTDEEADPEGGLVGDDVATQADRAAGEDRGHHRAGEELYLEQSTVNRQVHAALQSGVVERSRPSGSPTYLVGMSDAGRERFLADMDRLLAVYDRAVAAVPAAEQERFLEHLAAFVAALDPHAVTATG